MAELYFPAKALKDPKVFEEFMEEYGIIDAEVEGEKGIVYLRSPLARNEEFTTLEALLKESGFSFDRFGSQTEELSGERRYVRIDPPLDVVMNVDTEAEPFVLVSEIKEILSSSNNELRNRLEELVFEKDPVVPPLVGDEEDYEAEDLIPETK